MGTGPGVRLSAAQAGWNRDPGGLVDRLPASHGMEHICHHPASMPANWLPIAPAMVVERLYRLCYLHRNTHPVRSAIDLAGLLGFNLGFPRTPDTS